MDECPEPGRDPETEQIEGWEKHITFTGSKTLISQLEETEPEDLPVLATIIKQPIGDGRKCFYKFV